MLFTLGKLARVTAGKFALKGGRARAFTDKTELIKELKRELEDARFKNVVLETLVDVAERELGIPIRKKYGAKRSVK